MDVCSFLMCKIKPSPERIEQRIVAGLVDTEARFD
jgi:hypothetical protein